MSEVKAVKEAVPVEKVVVDKSKFEYVDIPEKDLFDQDHPGVGINFTHYGPGRHLVDPVVAETIKDRLLQFQRQQIRLLQPNRDLKAIKVVENTGHGGHSVPGESIVQNF